METEFRDIDQRKAWNRIFQELRNESNNYSYNIKDAKKVENKNLNRYRDVNPFDHTRVRLQRNELDYINASLVNVGSTGRSYILTQGPLPLTTGHFWLMIWEQNSTGILMLNRVVEKNTVKCHQYWPVGKKNGGEDTIIAHDVNLKITIIHENNDHPDYITRAFCLTDLESSESRIILQFHYVTWPDFGVPETPAAFLDFLFAVRESGILNNNVGPPIVHCSAGIGRSGTFCLVDSCLVLVEKHNDINCINVRKQLLEMRHYRMGLIQTPEQLRFSYLAILEGAHRLLFQKNILQNGSISNELLYQDSNSNTDKQADSFSPDLVPLTLASDLSQSSDSVESLSSSYTGSLLSEKKNVVIEQIAGFLKESVPNKESSPKEEVIEENASSTSDSYKSDSLSEVRKRARKEREERTALIVQNIKIKQRESERWQKKRSYLNISMGIALIIGLGYFAFKMYSKS